MKTHYLIVSSMCAALALLLGQQAFAAAQKNSTTCDQPQLISSAFWRTSDTLTFGWETVAFDDSAWNEARAPYPSPISPTDLIPGTSAQFIWHDPSATSDGTTGVNEAFLRFSFDLDLVDFDGVSAIARSSVDDDYNLYVNGVLVLENHDNGFGDVVDMTDIAPYLQYGTNVIAIHAVDGGWSSPFNRGYERVLFDLYIEPALYGIPILSSGDWLTSHVAATDWETPDFDDSDWAAARAPYPSPISPTDLLPSTNAQFIWHDPGATSDGSTGVNEAFLRLSFDLDLANVNVPLSAIAKTSVDDDYDLYVNGVLVLENHDGGFADLVDTTDIARYLHHGTNVIAIHAVDGGWGNPHDRLYERVLFDACVKPVAYINIPILSDSDWLTSDNVTATDWETPAFDDSGWVAARAPYPGALAATLITDSAGHSIWHDPSAVYDGTDGPVKAWFRYHFDIPDVPAALPVIGKMTISVDDDYDLYVNGVLVHENHDEGFAHIVETVDFTSELTVGHNVIAIHAVDGGWSSPHNRSFERVTLDGLVATGTDDYAADTDGDGTVDTADNCVIHHNSAQTDTNDDGYGNACDPDVTNDGRVNFLDAQQMEAIFFGSDADNDLNHDGAVNFADLAILEAFFFGTPGPSALVN